MMLYPSKKKTRSCLLALLLPSSALAGKEADVTKTFKFKDDFFLEFQSLPTAIGPDSVDVLTSALDEFAETFRDVWTDEIEANLLGGECTVDRMRPPRFSMCDWRYPDRYDVDELPTPGQCYHYQDNFVSSMLLILMLTSFHQYLHPF